MVSLLERIFLRVWLRIPPWLIAWSCAVATIGYVLLRADDYLDFWQIGRRIRLPDGEIIRVPLTRILVDMTFIIMGASFITRRPAIKRADQAWHIWIAGLGGCYPMLPFFFDGFLQAVAPDLRSAWRPFFLERHLSFERVLLGTTLIVLGNAIDVWGYLVLRRSFSIVPEARKLVTGGPYRFIRHPVYFGQLLAQAGIYLCFATFHGGWVIFYAGFTCIQLYRSRLEERVLEEAFNQDYREFKTRSRWFWR